MPMGDPAGYLPSVLKARKRAGKPAYEPQAKYMPRVMRGDVKMPKLPKVGGRTIPRPQFSAASAPAREYLTRKKRQGRG